MKADRNPYLRPCLSALGITALVGIFSAVYEHFGHGVYSNYMIYAFLFPLLLLALPRFVLLLLENRRRGRERPLEEGGAVWTLWNAGAATLTLGSLFRGILEIYGTQSPLEKPYFLLGALLLVLGALLFMGEKGRRPAALEEG